MKVLGFLALTLGSTVFGNARIVIPAEGLTRLSEYISSEFLKDIRNWPLPSARSTVGGFKLSVNDITFSAEVTGLDVRPMQDAIQVELRFRRGRVKAGNINARKDMLVPVSATCYRTEIVQTGPEAKVVGRYSVTLDQGRIVLQQLSLTCDLQPNHLSLEGPGRCSGAMGVGSLVKKAVRSYLSKSMGKITRNIENRLAKELPAAERIINDRIGQHFSLGGGVEFVPDTAILAKAIGLEIGPEAISANFRLSVDEKNSADSGQNAPSKDFMIGQFGVSPQFIAETMTYALGAAQHRALEFTPFVSRIGSVLSLGVEEVLGVSNVLAVVEEPGLVRWLPFEKSFLATASKIVLLEPMSEEELVSLEVDFQIRVGNDGQLNLGLLPGRMRIRTVNPGVSDQTLRDLEANILSQGEVEILSPGAALPIGKSGLVGYFRGVSDGMVWITLDDSRI